MCSVTQLFVTSALVQLFVTPWRVARLVCYTTSQARILEWVAISSSSGHSLPRDQTMSLVPPALAGRFFITVTPGKPLVGRIPHCCTHLQPPSLSLRLQYSWALWAGVRWTLTKSGLQVESFCLFGGSCLFHADALSWELTCDTEIFTLSAPIHAQALSLRPLCLPYPSLFPHTCSMG